jgi:hypothetical protein
MRVGSTSGRCDTNSSVVLRSAGDVIGIVAAAEAFGPAAVGAAVTPAHHDDHRPAAAGELQRLGQHPERRHIRAIGRCARRAVRQQRQRIAAGFVRANEQGFEHAQIAAEKNAQRLQNKRAVGPGNTHAREQNADNQKNARHADCPRPTVQAAPSECGG